MYRFIFDLFTETRGGVVALILGVVFYLGFHIMFPDYNKIECTSAEQPCVITSNFFGFKSSKKTFAPVNVVNTKVKDVRYGFSRGHRKYRHKVYLVDKYGNKDLVFRDILLGSKANSLAADVLYCITARKYPCSVRK